MSEGMDISLGEDQEGIANRKRLMKRIRADPGLSFKDLVKVLGINEGTLRYHLHYLERKSFVFSRKEGRKRLYYSHDPNHVRAVREDDLPLDRRRVLDIISGEPGICVSEIAKRLDMSKARCYRVTQRLKKDHLVMEVRDGNVIGYVFVTRQRLAEEMLMDLAEKMLRGEVDRETFFRLKRAIEEG